MLSPYALESIRFPNVRIVTQVSSLGFRMRNGNCMKFSVYFCQHPFSSCLSSFHHSDSSSKLRNVYENTTLPIQHLQRMRPQLKVFSIGPFNEGTIYSEAVGFHHGHSTPFFHSTNKAARIFVLKAFHSGLYKLPNSGGFPSFPHVLIQCHAGC